MGLLSKDSDSQVVLANEKSAARKVTAATPEVKSLPRNPKEQLEDVKQKLVFKKDYTEHYQNTILRLNPKKIWKKRDNASVHYSRDFLGTGPKVLIVEDNQFNVFPIKKTLNRNHINFDWAKNGLEAVEKYNETMKEW